MFVFPLISCMFFLLVISFVHPCLPLAVLVCLQSGFFSPLHPLGFPFHLTHPLGRSPLSHVLLALLLQETQPAGEGPACSSPVGADPLKSWLPSHSPTASHSTWARLGGGEEGLGKDCLHGGVEEPVIPCSTFSMPGFCSGARRFPASSHVLGRRRGASCPTGTLAGNLSAPLQKPLDRALSPPERLRRSSRLLQGGAAAGAAQQSEQGNETGDSRQGERF